MLLLALCSCSPQEPQRIAMHNWLGYQTLPLALEMDWIDKREFEIVPSTSASFSMDLFREAKVEAAALTLDEALKLCSEGMDISVVSVFDISSGADVVLSRHDLNSLKTKDEISIAYESTGLGQLMFAKFIEAFNFDKEQFSITSITADKHVDHWNDYHPDILITYEPIASTLIKNAGAYRLTDTRKMSEIVFDVLVVKSNALDSNIKAWKSVINAQHHAIEYMGINKEDFLYRVAKLSGIPKPEVETILRGLHLPNKIYAGTLLHGKSPKLVKKTAEIQKILASSGSADQSQPDCADKLFH